MFHEDWVQCLGRPSENVTFILNLVLKNLIEKQCLCANFPLARIIIKLMVNIRINLPVSEDIVPSLQFFVEVTKDSAQLKTSISVVKNLY